MTLRQTLVFALALVASAAPAAAQRSWVEVSAPHLTVVSDAGAGRARDVAWQFEQIREALARTFPWVRLTASRPLVVVAARNATTMRTLAPGLWERGRDGNLFVSSTATGPVSSAGPSKAHDEWTSPDSTTTPLPRSRMARTRRARSAG